MFDSLHVASFNIFYFVHFEVLYMNFEIFHVLSSLFVHICIVSFQLFFSNTFWITLFIWFCWCYFISCFVFILIRTFISIKYSLFMFWFLLVLVSKTFIYIFNSIFFCNGYFYKFGYDNSTFIFQKLNLVLFQTLKNWLR
jgi:hypothetical protein